MQKSTSQFHPGKPLPNFKAIDDVIGEALPALLPPARLTVSEVATRRMIEAGGHWVRWRNDVAPYMVEPMDLVTSRRFDSVVFCGPARSSKSEALVINPLVHSILAQPRLVSIFNMTQGAASELSVEKIDPTISHSPELAARLTKDNVFEKRFLAGGRLTLDWPVRSKLAARSIPLVILSDYDAMPSDVSNEGSVFAMGRKRTQSAGTRGMTIVESSPRFPILDESWTASSPHEAPPTGGILAIYNLGTRGRYYWTCRDCGGQFEPTFERLQFPKEGLPSDRGDAAYMACNHCGSVVDAGQKAEFNRAGQWLHESGSGELVPMGDGVRNTQIASFWLNGAAAAFAPWSQIVARYIEGVSEYRARGDENALKSAVNVELGMPYLPKSRGNSAKLGEKFLREKATDAAWKTAPKGTRFITIAIDVQPGRFVVQVEAWRDGLERTVIDRFDIHTPPDSSPGANDRIIDPAGYEEDWDALIPLADLVYPVATENYGLKPLSIVCDMNGEAGVTPNAYTFYRKRRASHPRRFHLVRGVGGENAKRAEVKAPESSHQGKKKIARDILIVRAGTDRLKDEVAASLIRGADGARALHISKFAPKEIYAEYSAERRGEKGWEKKPGVKRNEALDLSVYNLALIIVLGCEQIKENAPPAWALPDARNAFAVLNEVEKQDEKPDPVPDVKTPANSSGWKVKRPGRRRGY